MNVSKKLPLHAVPLPAKQELLGRSKFDDFIDSLKNTSLLFELYLVFDMSGDPRRRG